MPLSWGVVTICVRLLDGVLKREWKIVRGILRSVLDGNDSDEP